MKIGIIGQGFVGNAVYQKLKLFFEVFTYDLDVNKSNSSLSDIKINCNIIFICLPTPMNPDGSCDISIVESVVQEFSSVNDVILVIKSTVPPGTTEYFNSKHKKLSVVFNPEFLTERNAVEDYENQSRIIIGGPRPASTTLKTVFNRVFPNAEVIKTGSKHAEMIKYFTNSFLATKVSFANEIYEICKKLELDYDKIIEYVTHDKRISKSHLSVPGPDGDLGFGGHCFPKDLSALIKLSNDLGTTNNVIKAVIKTNDKVRNNRDWEKMKGRAIN